MPRYRRTSRLQPVNSRKEIIDSTLLGVSGGTTSDVTLVAAVEDYTGVVGTVEVGSTVSAIYLFAQIIPESSSVNVDFLVYKNAANMLDSPTVGATGTLANRRFIFHEEKGIPGTLTAGAGPLTFRGVIRIPPRFRRFGEDDTLRIRLVGAQMYDACVKCIYKRFL